MNGNHLVEFLEWILLHGDDRAVMPGIIHQDIDAGEFFTCGGNYALAVRTAGQIRDLVSCQATGGDYFHGCRRQFGFGSCGQEDASAFPSKQFCHCAADAAARACDQCHFVF